MIKKIILKDYIILKYNMDRVDLFNFFKSPLPIIFFCLVPCGVKGLLKTRVERISKTYQKNSCDYVI